MPARKRPSRPWELPAAFSPYFPSRDVISDSATPYPNLQEIKRKHSPRKVFLDIPYDEEFLLALLPAVVTSCWAFDLQPFRMGDDAGGPRLKRLTDHLLQSHFVVSDLSRERRMNMPFELGVAIGLGRSCAILVDDHSRLLRDFSDLAGMDLLVHGNKPRSVILQLCRWFTHQFQQRRWPVSAPVHVDRLISVVEPTIREFVVASADHQLTLDDLRQALTAHWNNVSVGYLGEYAQAHRLPFDEKVAESRIATMRAFLPQAALAD